MVKSLMIWAAALALAAGWASAATARDIPAADGLPITKYLQVAVRPSSPRVDEFVGDDRAHAAYELYVINFGDQPIRIVAVKIAAGASGPIFSRMIDRDELTRDFVRIGARREARQTPLLGRGESGVIFLFPDFGPPEKTPAALVNSLDIEVKGKPDTEQRLTIAPIEVSRDGAVVIRPPFTGANWLAANGPSNTSAHRRTILTVDGHPRIGQRFAIDFVRLGADGRTYHGDPNRNASYLAYDTPIAAVAAGTIAATLDGVPENTPQSPKMAVELTLSNVGGNFIAEKIGDGRYVMYAHLKPGSLKVKPGDKVAAGQIIARLGNTGNSTEPHLHLQVCDAPSFAASSGIPYEFDSFGLEKYRIDRKDGQPINLAIEGSTRVERQTPMEDELVDFPAGQ
jgi:murein DD-endopeptidase